MPNDEDAEGCNGGVWLKRALSIVVMVCCVCASIGCIFLIDDAFEEESNYSTTERMTAVLTYGAYVLICVVLFLVEWEPLWVFNYALFLHYWPGRGMLHVYMGVQLLHNAATMSNVDIFSMDGDSVKTAVKVFGWCFFGAGVFHIVLGLMCIRKDDKQVVKRVRGGKSYKPPTEQHLIRNAAAQLTLLRKLDAEGVPHLQSAITDLEAKVQSEQANSGVSGWFRSRFGKKDKTPPAPAQGHSRPGVERQPANPIAEIPRHGDVELTEKHSADPPTTEQCLSVSSSPYAQDDDIALRRKREDEAIELAYLKRQQQYR
ncbi:hypothetical protein DIPPA_00306 [Diplonema papillatum]|nr:hypothetical protein DIPPA_00306 [Diplonema papillatum]